MSAVTMTKLQSGGYARTPALRIIAVGNGYVRTRK